jgi:hypothetical protein
MVDQKHRYGSNLRAYHDHWKVADTHENFFYWLDYGEGSTLDLDICSREMLDKERVRYLSREERQQYLVEVDKDGRLVWAKNGQRITTSVDYRDSINGVVPIDDKTPNYDFNRATPSSISTDTSSESSAESDAATRYVNGSTKDKKSVQKVVHVSAGTILNHLLRKTVKKNTWIFVADVSQRLYIGIKQSGAFQHSSFMHGSRISAAGTLKIKDGQLRSLSPLSGHYRPPASNFKAFVGALKEHNVDMSHVSISKSYAVLVGLEAYVKTRRKFKHAGQKAEYKKAKATSPERVAREEEEAKDMSASAQKEREVLAREAERDEREGLLGRMKRHLHIGGKHKEAEKEDYRLSLASGGVDARSATPNGMQKNEADLTSTKSRPEEGIPEGAVLGGT